MRRVVDIPFVAWPERLRQDGPRCLFTGMETLEDVAAARVIAATAERLPDVRFDVAGPVAAAIAPAPVNVRLHEAATPELFRCARLGLSPLPAVRGGNDRVVAFLRAGLPVIASPEASRGLEPALAACCLVCAPEPASLRDAIVESLDWDWSGPVAEARRIACGVHGHVPGRVAA